MNADERLMSDGLRYFFGVDEAIDGKCVSGRNGRFVRHLDKQRTGTAHFFFEQPGRGVLGGRLERVGADEFGEVFGFVRGSGADGTHFVEIDRESATRTLPCGFGAGQSSADDGDFGSHFVECLCAAAANVVSASPSTRMVSHSFITLAPSDS